MTWLLTPTQRRVLQHVAGGASNFQTALILDISKNTVRIHLCDIFKRLGVIGRTHAVFEAIRLGEVDELQAYADLEARRRCAVGLKY